MTDDLEKELQTAINFARGQLDRLEDLLAKASPAEQADIRNTMVSVIGALWSHGRVPRSSKKPPRGVGYSFDEAQIVASLEEYGNSLIAAPRPLSRKWTGMA